MGESGVMLVLPALLGGLGLALGAVSTLRHVFLLGRGYSQARVAARASSLALEKSSPENLIHTHTLLLHLVLAYAKRVTGKGFDHELAMLSHSLPNPDEGYTRLSLLAQLYRRIGALLAGHSEKLGAILLEVGRMLSRPEELVSRPDLLAPLFRLGDELFERMGVIDSVESGLRNEQVRQFGLLLLFALAALLLPQFRTTCSAAGWAFRATQSGCCSGRWWV